MEWLEASITTTSDGVETVCAVLLEIGVTGVQICDDYDMRMYLENNTAHWDYADEELLNKEKGAAKIVFYIAADGTENETVHLIRNSLDTLKNSGFDYGAELGELSLAVSLVNDDGWLDNWKKFYKPFRIGRKVTVKPVWEELSEELSKELSAEGIAPGGVVFTINPGHVFGTGLHQSTQMCVLSLEKLLRNDTPAEAAAKVLDIGCGSGILSIIAMLLGAGSAVAVDTDPACVGIAVENAGINNVDLTKYEVFPGNIINDERLLEEITGKGKFDIVLANIIADVVIALSPVVNKLIKPGGTFITSGIIKERLAEVIETLSSCGFEITGIFEADEWRSVAAIYRG